MITNSFWWFRPHQYYYRPVEDSIGSMVISYYYNILLRIPMLTLLLGLINLIVLHCSVVPFALGETRTNDHDDSGQYSSRRDG